jgi:hypothetical protein
MDNIDILFEAPNKFKKYYFNPKTENIPSQSHQQHHHAFVETQNDQATHGNQQA